MSIDRIVEQRADAYRNNPAALQKNYQVSQDLLDLLALQKIKSEKDAAKREIEMSQNPESKTVAEQRANEAIGRTKEELLEQVGGIAKLQKGRQQQNLQRAAAGAPPANPQMAQMAGIANQSAPNMARMAKGGIVSFAGPEGSQVKSPTPEELLREAGFQGDIQEFYNLPKEKQERVLSTLNYKRSARRPGMDASAGAYLLDVLGLPVQTASGLVHRGARALGLMDPDQAGWQEDREWSATKHLQRVAADPMNQPVTMGQLIPPVANRQPGNIGTPYTGPDIAGTYDPLAPPVTDPNVDPAVDPNQNIQGTSFAVADMGTPDTTALDSFVTPQRRISKERNFELDRVRADMRKGASALETRMGQDRTTAGTTAQDAAAKFQNRTGVQTAYDKMYAARDELAKRQAADRKANLWSDLGAAAGGEGAFANIGREAANRRRAEQLQEQRDLGGLQDLRREQLATDQTIAQQSLAAGQKAEELTQQDINNATTNHRAVMADLEGSLSKEAKRGLDIDIANMGAEQWEAQIRFDTILAKLKGSTQRIVAEYNGKIRARGQDVQLRAIESDDRGIIMRGVEATDRMMADIQASIETAVQEALGLEVVTAAYNDMDATGQANRKNEIRRNITEAFNAQIIAQRALRKRLMAKLTTALDQLPDDFGGGFSNPEQISQ